MDPNGNIYGLTSAGGIGDCIDDQGCGVAFEITQ
jgi:hypothetical protein